MIRGRIESVAFGGEGILRHEGLVIFVPFTAPGDVVLVEIIDKKKSFARGRLLTIETPSTERATPQCPYFGHCGGCQLQHVNYPSQVQIKKAFIQDALKRIAKLEIDDLSVIPAKQEWHYRRHIRLKLKKDSHGFIAGYISADNTSFIPVAECPIFLPTETALLKMLQPLLASLDPTGIDEASLRIIKAKPEQFLFAFHFSPTFPKNLSLFQNEINESVRGIVAAAAQEQKYWGEIDCEVQLLGLKARFAPFGFVQIHPEQSINLYQAILDALPSDAEKVLDLYCGIGLTTLLFARTGKKVIGIESHAETIALAKQNASMNALSATFLKGKAESLGPRLLDQEHFDAVLLNPPRTGIDPKLIQALLFKKPACILYVSCMPATLARDLQKLTQGGYRLQKVQGFDMFPQTTHVETLVKLTL